MGVKDLWTILSPVSEKKSLWDLQSKNVAVDLSAWICDSQNVGDSSQRNMYLRNLFFRTSFLLLLGCKPIFVLEGTAPKLKHDAMAARRQARTGREKGEKSGNRARLISLQKQCEKFLKTMGVPCIQATGEAEAYCAWLNKTNVVDAVITQDSDSFLYGARVVLRNFTMSPTYVCEEHNIDTIEHKLSLGRHKLMALSLLCGCDYNKGVNGVGKESAMKFLSTLEDFQVLRRLKDWRDDPFYKALEKRGSSQLSPEQRLELSIRKKALQDPDFPSEEIIEEYLNFVGDGGRNIPNLDWSQPDLTAFIKLADYQLSWEDSYAVEKFLPLLTRWHLLNWTLEAPIRCEMIMKKRVARGINSFEVKWNADFMFDNDEIQLVTVEPRNLLENAYRSLVEEYIASTTKPKKVATRKKKTTNSGTADKRVMESETALKEITNVSELLSNLSFEEKYTAKKQPRKKRVKEIKGVQTLDKFLIGEDNKCKATSLVTAAPWNDTFLPLQESTPNKFEWKVNNLDLSFHYTPDKGESASNAHLSSVRKRKTKILVNEATVVDEEATKNYDGVIKNLDRTDLSLLELLDDDEDQSCFDLSNIVNSIVSRKDNTAVNALLRSENL